MDEPPLNILPRPLVKVVHPEVAIDAVLAGEQVAHNHQDGVPDGDGGFLLAPAGSESAVCRPMARCRCSSSMRAMMRSRSSAGWPVAARRCSSASAPGAVATATRPPCRRAPRGAAHSATARSSCVPTWRRGQCRRMCQDSDEGWWGRSYSRSVGALVATRRRTTCPVLTAPRPRQWNSPATPPSASARSAAVDAARSSTSGRAPLTTSCSTRPILSCSWSCR